MSWNTRKTWGYFRDQASFTQSYSRFDQLIREAKRSGYNFGDAIASVGNLGLLKKFMNHRYGIKRGRDLITGRALVEASKYGHYPVVDYLLKKINFDKKTYEHAIGEAVMKKYVKITKLILSKVEKLDMKLKLRNIFEDILRIRNDHTVKELIRDIFRITDDKELMFELFTEGDKAKRSRIVDWACRNYPEWCFEPCHKDEYKKLFPNICSSYYKEDQTYEEFAKDRPARKNPKYAKYNLSDPEDF